MPDVNARDAAAAFRNSIHKAIVSPVAEELEDVSRRRAKLVLAPVIQRVLGLRADRVRHLVAAI
jgi:hypothetical protein